MSTQTTIRPGADPSILFDLIGGITRYWVVVAALELGLFEALARGTSTTAGLAERCDAPAKGVGVLCDVLADLGLVEPLAQGWALTATADAHLVRGGERRVDGLFLHGPGHQANLEMLARTARGEPPPRSVDEDDDFWRRIFAATLPTQRRLAREIASVLPPTPGAAVLEVGPSAGAWAIGYLESHQRIRAVVDCRLTVRPDVAVAAAEAGVAARLTMVAGRQAGFAVVILANTLRLLAEDEARRLVTTAVSQAAPGGAVVAADYFIDADGQSGVSARLMAATMLANTRKGGAVRIADVSAWLEGAGCADVQLLEPLAGLAVLVARRPAEAVEVYR